MSYSVPSTASNKAATSGGTASKPLVPFGMVPAPEIESYDVVPWYRKTWFVFIPLFVPALIIAATGNVYAKANQRMKKRANSDAEVWRSTVANRVVIVVSQLVFLLALADIFLFVS